MAQGSQEALRSQLAAAEQKWLQEKFELEGQAEKLQAQLNSAQKSAEQAVAKVLDVFQEGEMNIICVMQYLCLMTYQEEK